TDPKCTVFFGGAGALTPGGLKKVMRDMVEFGLVDVVVTTGAIAYHDFYEAHGHRHYKSSPDADDIVLREHFLDRVYDTLADESLFRECDDEIAALADGLEPRPYSSREILWDMGKIASKDPNSLVGACYRKGIPYFVPALNDSSIGIALAKHHHDRVKKGKEPIAGEVPQRRQDGPEPCRRDDRAADPHRVSVAERGSQEADAEAVQVGGRGTRQAVIESRALRPNRKVENARTDTSTGSERRPERRAHLIQLS